MISWNNMSHATAMVGLGLATPRRMECSAQSGWPPGEPKCRRSGIDNGEQRNILAYDVALETQWLITINATLPGAVMLGRAALRRTVSLRRVFSFDADTTRCLTIGKLIHGLVQLPPSIVMAVLGLPAHGACGPNLEGT